MPVKLSRLVHQKQILVVCILRPLIFVHRRSRKGAFDVVKHLVSLGDRRIGFVGISPEDSLIRYTGYASALRDAGIELCAEYTVGPRAQLAVSTQEDGFKGMMRLANLRKPPTPVLACNDFTAIGALRAANRLGLALPRDMAMAGFDHIPPYCIYNATVNHRRSIDLATRRNGRSFLTRSHHRSLIEWPPDGVYGVHFERPRIDRPAIGDFALNCEILAWASAQLGVPSTGPDTSATTAFFDSRCAQHCTASRVKGESAWLDASWTTKFPTVELSTLPRSTGLPVRSAVSRDRSSFRLPPPRM